MDSGHHATARAGRAPWDEILKAAAALAAAMGVGRFVYTAILPLMHAQAGLSTSSGADLATANYIGYLVGALAGSVSSRLARSAAALRLSLVVLVASLAAMPLTTSVGVWFGLRLVAGVASALVFVIAAGSLLGRLRRHAAHLPGWAFGGVGTGIALSGALVLVLRPLSDWRGAWWASAALAAAFAAAAWFVPTDPRAGAGADDDAARPAGRPGPPPRGPRTRPWFAALFTSYSLEGVGYIIAGTFLVAAIEQNSPGWVGTGAWVLVGIAAIPASALWSGLGTRFSRPSLLVASLVVQAIGIALPALVAGVAPALVSAFLFGATFLGVSSLALATGTHLRVPRAVAVLTAGYSVGQILGPLVVSPLLRSGYHDALLLASGVVLAAALASALLRIRYPHTVPAGGAVGAAAAGGRQHAAEGSPARERS